MRTGTSARSVVATEGPDDGPSVELGQHEVEDDESRPLGGDGGERGAAVGRGRDAEAVALEVHPDEADDLGVVVDDEDGAGRDWVHAHCGC